MLLEHLGEGMVPAPVAEKITARLTERFDIDGYEIYVGASIGITLCPDDGVDAGTLLKNADLAMYRAKQAGRNMISFFTEEMTEQAQRFVSMENDLRHAAEEGQLSLHYQPIVSLDSGAIAGVEALLRWTHPRRGQVPPAEFIPVAEESGLVADMGMWVLRRACSELMSATAPGSQPPRLSINVSSRQFRAGFGSEPVSEVLRETGFPATRLVFEITESTLLDHDQRVRDALEGLRACGTGLAVDGFGTGFSSLSYLRPLPVTELKIDRSFVRDLETDPGDAKLVETIVAMARALDLIAVAEGVETEGQRTMLLEMGCPLAQGFHLGAPVPLARMWPRRLVDRAGSNPETRPGSGRPTTSKPPDATASRHRASNDNASR